MVHRIRTPTGPGKSWESTKNDFELPADYTQWLSALKRRIRGARQRALLSVNQEQIRLYHEIGQEIFAKGARAGEPKSLSDYRLICALLSQT
jgi:hypothetical protein